MREDYSYDAWATLDLTKIEKFHDWIDFDHLNIFGSNLVTKKLVADMLPLD
jgi:hypothetical protein